MNWIDVALVGVILIAIFAGLARGFIFGMLDLLTWVGSFVLGYIFYPFVANWLGRVVDIGVWLLPVAFMLTTITARLLIGLVLRVILPPVTDRTHRDGLNRFLGMIPGAINGWICAVILAALLLALPLKDEVTEKARESRFAGPLAMQSEWVNRKLAPVFNDAIRQTMNSLTVKPESGEKVDLPFRTSNAKPRPSLETRMLAMVNAEREKHGLKPLAGDPELTAVARNHSLDMFSRGFFAHVNPDGKDPFDRMRAARVSFSEAGENLALAQTLEIAHNNLMNSPGHRANILSPAFGRLGIGVLDGGYYGLMISQEFRN